MRLPLRRQGSARPPHRQQHPLRPCIEACWHELVQLLARPLVDYRLSGIHRIPETELSSGNKSLYRAYVSLSVAGSSFGVSWLGGSLPRRRKVARSTRQPHALSSYTRREVHPGGGGSSPPSSELKSAVGIYIASLLCIMLIQRIPKFKKSSFSSSQSPHHVIHDDHVHDSRLYCSPNSPGPNLSNPPPPPGPVLRTSRALAVARAKRSPGGTQALQTTSGLTSHPGN